MAGASKDLQHTSIPPKQVEEADQFRQFVKQWSTQTHYIASRGPTTERREGEYSSSSRSSSSGSGGDVNNSLDTNTTSNNTIIFIPTGGSESANLEYTPIEYDDEFAAAMNALSNGLPRAGGVTVMTASSLDVRTGVDLIIREAVYIVNQFINEDYKNTGVSGDNSTAAVSGAQLLDINAATSTLDALRQKKINLETGSTHTNIIEWAKDIKACVFDVLEKVYESARSDIVKQYMDETEEGFKLMCEAEKARTAERRAVNGDAMGAVVAIMKRANALRGEEAMVRELITEVKLE